MEKSAELIPAASFPVIFFDGEREVDIGNVFVHPSIGFKRFKTLISQKIGVSPHQILTSLVRRKKARSSPEVRRKVPIDESSDFAAIARERDCFVLTILKRSRRTRSRRRSERGSAIAVETESSVPKKTILKRCTADGSGVDVPGADGLRLWDYEKQLHDMKSQREKYLMSTAVTYPAAAAPASPEVPPEVAARLVVCEECVAAEVEGRSKDFHWCVYDAVTVGFRSAVGPIQRPSKKH